jgi:hypothetical protein
MAKTLRVAFIIFPAIDVVYILRVYTHINKNKVDMLSQGATLGLALEIHIAINCRL